MVCNSILKNAAFDSAIVRNRGYKISIRNGCIFANYQVTVGCDGVPYVNGKKIIVCWRTGAQGQNFTIFIGIVSPAITSVDIMLVDCLVRDIIQNRIKQSCPILSSPLLLSSAAAAVNADTGRNVSTILIATNRLSSRFFIGDSSLSLRRSPGWVVWGLILFYFL